MLAQTLDRIERNELEIQSRMTLKIILAIQEFIFWTTQRVRMFSLNLLVREYFLVLCSPSPHHHHHNFSNNPTLAFGDHPFLFRY